MSWKYFWLIILFLALMVGLNFISFLIYQDAFQDQEFSKQLWKYLDSDVSKLINAAFTLPIILLLLESRFKILQAAREKRKSEIEDRKQEKIDQRRNVLKGFISEWTLLFDLMNKIRFYEENINTDDAYSLNQVQIGIFNSINKWEKNLDELIHYYPTLRSLESLFLYYLNFFINMSTSTASHIKDFGKDGKKIRDLQNAFEVIVGHVKGIWYYNFVAIIRAMNERHELIDKSGPKMTEISVELKSCVGNLQHWGDIIATEEMTTNMILSNLDDKGVAPFKKDIDDLLLFLKEDPSRSFKNYENGQKIEDGYNNIDRAKMMRSMNVHYSVESILDIAQTFGYESFAGNLVNRAKKMGLNTVVAEFEKALNEEIK